MENVLLHRRMEAAHDRAGGIALSARPRVCDEHLLGSAATAQEALLRRTVHEGEISEKVKIGVAGGAVGDVAPFAEGLDGGIPAGNEMHGAACDPEDGFLPELAPESEAGGAISAPVRRGPLGCRLSAFPTAQGRSRRLCPDGWRAAPGCGY